MFHARTRNINSRSTKEQTATASIELTKNAVASSTATSAEDHEENKPLKTSQTGGSR
jgi:hypothetical protein